MSRWLRDHIRVVNNFGEVVRDLSRFFRAAQAQVVGKIKKGELTDFVL